MAGNPKGSLPYGWQVQVSKNHPDRVYYFNVHTAASTWECPILDPPKSYGKVKDDRPYSTKVAAEACRKSIAEFLPSFKTDKERSAASFKLNTESKSKPTKSNLAPTAVVAPVLKHERINLCRKRKEYECEERNNLNCEEICFKKTKKKSSGEESIDNNSNSVSEKSNSPQNRKKKKNRNRKKSKASKQGEEKNSQAVPSTSASTSKKVPTLPVPLEPQISNATVVSVESSSEVCSDDVEMLDVSKELIDDLATKKETIVDAFASYYIVVDTNIFISELQMIDELKETPVNGCGPPHIFIPWIVIEELDKLKSGFKIGKSSKSGASEAVRYLNKVLSKHPRFHGQSPVEAEEWAKTYMGKCNDDRILECCMGLADKMSAEKVVLLTNDKNLMNKALICNINVHNASSLMEKIKPDVVIKSVPVKGKSKKRSSFPGSCNSMSTVPEISGAQHEIADETMLMRKRDDSKRDIHDIMSSARQLLKDVLSQFLEKEMSEAYGDIWIQFPIRKELLIGILQAIKKYWGTVYSLFMSEKDKRNFELLLEKAIRPEGYLGDRDECLNILSVIEDVFRSIKRRHRHLYIPVEKIQDFRALCVETYLNHSNIEKSIQCAEYQNTLALFERNWAAMNQLSGTILDFCGISHDFQYEKPSVLPSEIEFRRLICNLYPEVQQMKTHMSKVLEAVKNCTPIKAVFKKLYNSLLHFIPNLGIQYEPVTFPHFSIRTLQSFCMDPQNREKIEIGFKQLEMFYSKLDESVSVLMSTKFRKHYKSPETMICD